MEPEVKERNAKLKKRWQPKRWEPMYDQMVALSCTGMSNILIAKRFNYTVQQISNILTSENGKIIKALVSKHMQESLMHDAKTRMSQIEQKATEIVHGVLHNTELYEKSPLAMYDRAIKFLEGRGSLESPEQKAATRALAIPSDIAAKLFSGMVAANEAAKLHNAVEVRTIPDESDRPRITERKVS